jgi:XTP/dITP diphosphohydrolase
MDFPTTIVLGTRNAKKRRELAALLAPLGIELKTLDDFPESIETAEDGDSFAANAARKATQQARHLGRWVIGEDSGLSVDALGGAPGIYSARYAGPHATDAQNNARLLDALAETPDAERTAHFTSHVALSDPEGNVRIACEDYCHGRIRREPAGEGGFGYDPLFEIREIGRTFGELGPEIKATISHRGRALRRLVRELANKSKQGRI